MHHYSKIELSVGAFVVVGALALGYLAFTLGGLDWSARHYVLKARFASVGELKLGAAVKLAGVTLGEVKRIALVGFDAEVEFALDDDTKLPDDTIASIQSAGLLGDAYVSLSPGASDHNLASGARILQTESAVSLTEMLAKYAFGSPLSDDADEHEQKKPDSKPAKSTEDSDALE